MSETDKTKEILDEYRKDLDAISLIHQSFDDKERILMSQSVDQISQKETSSRITDPTLLSSVLKQNNEIMAQMPSGKITAMTKANKGKSLFMDLILHNHVIPNATSQFDVFTKLWLWSFYRKVYGSFGVLVDFVTNKNGYTGPDFFLLPSRDIIPQSGKTTVEDSDYIWIRSRVNKKWLETRDKKYWKNIDKLLKTKGDGPSDVNSQSVVQRQDNTSMSTKDEFELISRYEGDRWRTFHAGSNLELRDIPNPQKNGKIPVIMCHSYPLIDRFFGLGDFERGMTLHSASSSLISLYMDGVKMGIFPPLKIDASTVDNWDDFKDGIGPGQIWLMSKGNFDGVAQMNVSPQASDAFQSTYNFLKAMMLTVTQTSDASISSSVDPGFGKTPQALKMQAMTQGMQTQFDRRMLELGIEKVFDRMIDLISKKQEKTMNLYLKERDLLNVKEVAPDVVEMFETGDSGMVKIKPKDIANVEYRYEIDRGSTLKKDEIMENQTLTEIIGFVMKIPGALDTLTSGGKIPLGDKSLDVGELIKRWVISSGVSDWDKIITDNNEDGENPLNLEDPKVQGLVKQILQEIQNNPSAFSQNTPDNIPSAQEIPTTPPQSTPGVVPSASNPPVTYSPPANYSNPNSSIGDFKDPAFSEVMKELQEISQGNAR